MHQYKNSQNQLIYENVYISQKSGCSCERKSRSDIDYAGIKQILWVTGNYFYLDVSSGFIGVR